MQNLIPQFIIEKHQSGEREGTFEAAVLFLDLSGFTPLTERLISLGREGAETLTSTLNSVFEPLVAEVYSQGGFIITYAGDAFTALFPIEQRTRQETARRTLQTAFAIQTAFQQRSHISTDVGEFTLSFKLGLGLGTIQWRILGRTEAQTSFFRGDAIRACVQAESQAEPGEMIASPAYAAIITGDPDVTYEERAGYLHLLTSTYDFAPISIGETISPTSQTLKRFLLDTVVDSTQIAEFREVVSVFIAFDHAGDEAILGTFADHLLTRLVRYGGYLRHLDYGDKGAVAVVTFGAPVSYENDIQRAADFLLALWDVSPVADLKLHAGMTFGLVYAGYIGGQERSEYGVMGDVVNRAARLMAAAPVGEIWLGPSTAGRLGSAYITQSAGKQRFKGISTPIPITRLMGKHHHVTSLRHAIPRHRLVGRDAELQSLAEAIAPIKAGRFAGIIYVDGEAGAGKTHLIQALTANTEQVQRFVCLTDDILRQSLNPFRQFLRSYFNYRENQTTEENKAVFATNFTALLDGLPEASTLQAELERTKSFLGALIGLYWPDSLYEQLEPDLRFENTQIALKTLLIAESLRQPTIVHIEDGHWLDADTAKFLVLLTRNVADYPLAIVISSRYQDDRSTVRFDVDEDAPVTDIALRPLDEDALAALAEQIIGGPMGPELTTLLAKKSSGNPFFAEQILLDLMERQTLVERADGELEISADGAAKVPSSVSQVVIARLDRLSAEIKRIVQTASVIGQEFNIRVLSAMLHEDDSLRKKVARAEQNTIWAALDELRYLFHHALLRDAAYDMQLRARLRELHHLCATALETIHVDDLNAYAADIAYHFEQAQADEKTRIYTRLAGDYAAAQYANEDALTYFQKAFTLTPATNYADRFDLLMQQEMMHDRLGQRDAQQNLYDEAEALLPHLDGSSGIELLRRRGNLARITGDVETAQELFVEAYQIAEKLDLQSAQADTLISLGALFMTDTARAEQDIETLKRALTYIDKADTHRQVSAYARLAGGLNHLGRYEEAKQYLDKGTALFQNLNDKTLEVVLYNNLASYYYFTGDYPSAVEIFQRVREVVYQIGDRQREAVISSNLGAIASAIGDHAKSMHYMQNAVAVGQEIKDVSTQIRASINLAAVSVMFGVFAEARTLSEQALILLEKHSHVELAIRAHLNLSVVSGFEAQYDETMSHAEKALQLVEASSVLPLKPNCLTQIALALELSGHAAEAEAKYHEALEAYHAVGEERFTPDALSGLARLAVQNNALQQATDYVQQALDQLSPVMIQQLHDPFNIYVTAHDVYLAAGKVEQAAAVVREGVALLHEKVETIPDGGYRESYLRNIPANRELLALAQK